MRAWAWKYRENRKKEWGEDTRDDKQGKNTQPVEHSSEQKGKQKYAKKSKTQSNKDRKQNEQQKNKCHRKKQQRGKERKKPKQSTQKFTRRRTETDAGKNQQQIEW